MTARYDCLPPTPPPQSSFDDFLDILFPDRLRHPVPLLLAVVHRRRGRCRAGPRGVRPPIDRAQRADGELARPGRRRHRRGPALLHDHHRHATRGGADRAGRATDRHRPRRAGCCRGRGDACPLRPGHRPRAPAHEWRPAAVAPARHGRRPPSTVVAAPLAVAAVVGAVTAGAVTWFVGLGPAGVVHVIEPAPSRRLDAAALVTIGGLLVLSLLLLALMALRSARRPEHAPWHHAGWAARSARATGCAACRRRRDPRRVRPTGRRTGRGCRRPPDQCLRGGAGVRHEPLGADLLVAVVRLAVGPRRHHRRRATGTWSSTAPAPRSTAIPTWPAGRRWGTPTGCRSTANR